MYDQNRSDGPRSEGERPGEPGRRVNRDRPVPDPTPNAPATPGDPAHGGTDSYRFDPRARRRRYADEEDNHPVTNQPVPNEVDDTIEYPAVEIAETHPGAPATRHPVRPGGEDPAVPGAPMNPYAPRSMPENAAPGANHETADLRQPTAGQPSAPPPPPPYNQHGPDGRSATPPDLQHAHAQYRPPTQATPPADVAPPAGMGNPSPGTRDALPVTQPGEAPQPPHAATPPPDPSAHPMTDMEGTAHPQMSATPGNSQPSNPTPPNPEPTPPIAVRTINLSKFDLAPDQTRLIPALQEIPGVDVAELAEDPEGNGQLRLEIDPTMEEGPLRNAVQGVLTDQLVNKPAAEEPSTAEAAAAGAPPPRSRSNIPRSQRGQTAESETPAATSPPRMEERQLRRRQRPEVAGEPGEMSPEAGETTAEPVAESPAHPPAKRAAPQAEPAPEPETPSKSVAQAEPEEEEHHVEVRAEPLPGRFLLRQLDTKTKDLETEVTITLECDDVATTGAALSPAIDWHVHRATAVAALEALRPHLADDIRLEIEHVSIETAGPVNVALVVVLTMGGDAIQRRAGAAVVTADRRQAIVSATLSALAVQMAQ